MTETRRCKWRECRRTMITQRADAEFCSESCRTRYKNEERRKQSATDTRVTGVIGGVGSRGGNVRSVQEARDLQSEQKPKRDWAGAIDEQIRRTLLETGFFHTDDLDALEVPAEHCNLKGTRAAWFRNKRYMESTGVYRKVSHPAANGRKAPIYRITPLGRKQMNAGVGRDNGEGIAARSASGQEGGTLDRPGGMVAPTAVNGAPSSLAVHPGGHPAPVDPVVPLSGGGPSRAQVCDDVDPSGDSPAAHLPASLAAGESSPTLFDADQVGERPLNPLRDQEAA